MQIKCEDTEMCTGYVFSGEKKSELVKHIINKFAEEKLKVDEAREILQYVEACVGEVAVIQRVD